ncbi:MAG: rhodanese-like domain-containing protein, partial [Flavobacteriales bacterium]
EGALILDVRSPAEFENNHIKGAVNIPLNTLSKKLNKLKKDKVIITCCASGIRSASVIQFVYMSALAYLASFIAYQLLS